MTHLPKADFRCLADIDVEGIQTTSSTYVWPDWVVEDGAFRPEIPGDILFIDLDTSIIGSLGDIVSVNQPTLMHDIYRPEGLQPSIMYPPASPR